jgi:hypothetical protein
LVGAPEHVEEFAIVEVTRAAIVMSSYVFFVATRRNWREERGNEWCLRYR